MNKKSILCVVLAAVLATPPKGFAASHREAPITALDHKADITDFFAFVSYDDPSKVTFLLNVDPLLEPGNGPNYFPFDDTIQYAIRIDNNNDAQEDVYFLFQFQTEVRAPNVFTALVGAGTGINAPANSPAPVPPGTPIVPPAITALDGSGSEGLNLRQRFTVTMVKNGISTPLTNQSGAPLFAVPSNVGPRTMPNYPALAAQGVYSLENGIRVFAGTVDDPFYIDLGAAFDSLNFRMGAGGGVLSPAQDANDHTNTAPDFVSGYNVNTIAIEVPIAMLTSTGTRVAATDPAATIGAWGTTARPRTLVRRSPLPAASSGSFAQIQRMANPLINELIIGTGYKDYWSMTQPKDDSQFAALRSGSPARASFERGIRHQCAGGAAHGSAAASNLCASDRRARHAGRPGGGFAAAQYGRRAYPSRKPPETGITRRGRSGISERQARFGRRHRYRGTRGGWRIQSGVQRGAEQSHRGWSEHERLALSGDVSLRRIRAKRTRPAACRSGRSGLHYGRRGALPDQLSSHVGATAHIASIIFAAVARRRNISGRATHRSSAKASSSRPEILAGL